MARRRGNTNTLIGFAVLLGGGLWLLSKKAAASTPTNFPSASPAPNLPPVTPISVPGFTISPPAPVPGVIAPTGSAITASQAIWQNLTPTTGPDTGYVNFSTGSQAAAALLPFAMDDQGNYYTQWAGLIYLVNVFPNIDGNYSAKPLGT